MSMLSRDKVFELARSVTPTTTPWWLDDHDLLAFAAKVAQAEREACCDLLEGMHAAGTGNHNYYLHAAVELRNLRGKP